MHTRSIPNLLIKAMETEFRDKRIKNLSMFRSWISSGSLAEFICSVGGKAELPYIHRAAGAVNRSLSEICIPSIEAPFCDVQQEEKLLERFCANWNLPCEELWKAMQRLEDKIGDSFLLKNDN